MAGSMNRRVWLRNSALLTGGLTFLSDTLGSLAASATPAHVNYKDRFVSDAEFGNGMPPELKARLFANENPFGPSDKAKKAIEDALAHSYQYPFKYIDVLQEKIAAYEGINKNMILMSSGSSPLLLAAALYFSKDGGNIITGDPSYEDLPSRAKEVGAQWKKIPLTTEYKLDLDAMEGAIDNNTKLVYICNPNNPTATLLDTDKLKSFCERVSKKVAVFIDEAYIDYLPDPEGTTLIDCVKKGQNVIVARTFSKLYGFAGLRVGYIIAQREMIAKLNSYTSGPFCISATSVCAAIASYQDKEYLHEALQKTMASKEFLYKTLKDQGFEYVPSSANFVIFPIRMDGNRFVGEMMKRGVGVRNWKFNNKDWCRVSVGRMEEMEAFAGALKELS